MFYNTTGFNTAHNDTVMLQSMRQQDLCFTLVDREIRITTCDTMDDRQHFKIRGESSKFHIKPALKEKACVTQHHHPRDGEELIIDPCKVAKKDQTAYWTKKDKTTHWNQNIAEWSFY
mmetsp:Transcript_13616/g.30031  ORF Transcript_13616/g.30031 Transcript_13616/m.30031 type:complete len:118 (-) Transcript_13616:88-441(-)